MDIILYKIMATGMILTMAGLIAGFVFSDNRCIERICVKVIALGFISTVVAGIGQVWL